MKPALSSNSLPRRGDRRARSGPAAMRGAIRWSLLLLVALGIVIGVVAVGATTWAVNTTSTNEFCSNACHSMKWAAQAYERGPHFVNDVGVRATCSDCHIPFESEPATPFQYVFGTLWTKAVSGTEDVIGEVRGLISTEERWNLERPKLGEEVRAWFKETSSATCKGCHKLDAFASTGPGAFHLDLVKAGPVNCVECHADAGHRFPETAAAKP